MTYLNDAIAAGKITYIGISDTPAWIVSQANQYARDHALRSFVAYQGQYSAMTRDMEREIIPMALHEGMALVHWGVLGQGGLLKALQQEMDDSESASTTTNDDAKPRATFPLPPSQLALLPALATTLTTITASHSQSSGPPPKPAEILIAYARQKAPPHVIPVIGCRSTASLDSSIRALSLTLTDEEVRKIDEACPLDKGWPATFVAPDVTGRELRGPGDLWVARKDGIVVGGPGW